MPWAANAAEAQRDNRTTLGGMADELYLAGLGEEVIGRVLRTLGAVRIRAYLYKRKGRPTERETMAQQVLPLLQALGWTPQLTALEWARMDIALFRRLPRCDKNLDVVVEVKRHGADLSGALDQARRYAGPRPRCRRLVVTDGVRYGIYRRGGGRFRLHAYLDIARPRNSYPAFSCRGAKEALLSLLP